jgi:hypothetical protein
MSEFFSSDFQDDGLNIVYRPGVRVHVCSSATSTYSSVAGVSLGSTTDITITGPEDGSSNNSRRINFSVTSPTLFTSAGSPSHWILVNETEEKVLAHAALLGPPASVTTDDTFQLSSASITLTGLES